MELKVVGADTNDSKILVPRIMPVSPLQKQKFLFALIAKRETPSTFHEL
jgi:hypothetical protein